MNSRTLPRVALSVAVLLGACDRAPEGDDATLRLVPAAPETKKGILIGDGTVEPIELRRFESPPGAPLRFSTYLPEGFQAEPLELSDEAWGLRFTPVGSGGDAALEVEFHPEGSSESESRERVAEAARRLSSDGPPQQVGPPGGWGVVEHRFQGRTLHGTVTLGMHEGRFFHVVTRYRPDDGEVFRARAAWILEEWMWEDSGEDLHGIVAF